MAIFIASCSDDSSNNPTPTTPGESNVKVVDSYSGGSVYTPSGHGIEVTPGSVPETAGGAAAKVAFSVETRPESPAPLPAGTTQVGDMARFGPDGFVFRWPVRIALPFGAEENPYALSVLYYNPTDARWVGIPMASVDLEKRCAYADVLELGYYVLGKTPEFGKQTGSTSMGGFEFTSTPGYYYTLTVKSAVFKFPAQEIYYPYIIGGVAASGTDLAGQPNQPTTFILPQGSYEIWITRTIPGSFGVLPVIETYSIPAPGVIDRPLQVSFMQTTDWTILHLPLNGVWIAGRPQDWPEPTPPLGTGQMQATLTWVNTDGSAADLDLHLYGPDSMHVSWRNTSSDDGSIELDQDWLIEAGHAAENIYSTATMPSGHYRIAVHHFRGLSKHYAVRVILNGTVRTKTGTLTENQEHTILEFDI